VKLVTQGKDRGQKQEGKNSLFFCGKEGANKSEQRTLAYAFHSQGLVL
jgi:hypothetical protein